MAQPVDLRIPMRDLIRMAAAAVHFDLVAFARALLRVRFEQPHFVNMNHQLRERFVALVSELVAQGCLFNVTRDVAAGAESLNPRTRQRVAELQCEVALWLQQQVPKLLRASPGLYFHALRAALLLLPAEAYFGAPDAQLSDHERRILRVAQANTMLLEPTLKAIHALGVSELPLSPAEALMLLHHVVPRAAALHLRGVAPALTVHDPRVLDQLLELSVYHPNIKVADDFKPPQLAVQAQYWQAWQLMAFLVACNPAALVSSNQNERIRIIIKGREGEKGRK